MKIAQQTGRRRRRERLLFVCADLACFSPALNFDRLCLLLRSVSQLCHGQGRRDETTSLGKGRGAQSAKGSGWPEGSRGGGRGLTVGYKYLCRPDDHTVSQLETDGQALVGHLATLSPQRHPSQTQATRLCLHPTLMMTASGHRSSIQNNLHTKLFLRERRNVRKI